MTTAEDRGTMPTGADLAELLGLVARHRDVQAFAALFRHFAPRLKSFLARQGHTDAECEDLIQETMLNLWRRADSFDVEKAAVSTWIFTIARNCGIDRRRRLGRGGITLPPIEGIEEVDPDPSAEQGMIVRESEDRVRQALERLPAEQATVIRMSYFAENAQSEIAEALGIPLGTVKSRVRLALLRLRQLMEETA